MIAGRHFRRLQAASYEPGQGSLNLCNFNIGMKFLEEIIAASGVSVQCV